MLKKHEHHLFNFLNSEFTEIGKKTLVTVILFDNSKFSVSHPALTDNLDYIDVLSFSVNKL